MAALSPKPSALRTARMTAVDPGCISTCSKPVLKLGWALGFLATLSCQKHHNRQVCATLGHLSTGTSVQLKSEYKVDWRFRHAWRPTRRKSVAFLPHRHLEAAAFHTLGIPSSSIKATWKVDQHSITKHVFFRADPRGYGIERERHQVHLMHVREGGEWTIAAKQTVELELGRWSRRRGPTSSEMGRDNTANLIRLSFMHLAATRWIAGGFNAMPRLCMSSGSLPICISEVNSTNA